MAIYVLYANKKFTQRYAIVCQNACLCSFAQTELPKIQKTRSFDNKSFPAKLQAELFDVTHTLSAPRWRRSVVEFWEIFRRVILNVVLNILLCKRFIGVKKINGYSGVNFSFKP